MIVPGRGVTPITAAHDLRPTFGTPQASHRDIEVIRGEFMDQRED
jgi:hypothetical protein